MEAMTAVCRARFQEFGASGNADKIRPIPMSAMAKRYAAGELAPKFGVSKAAAE